MKIFPLKTQWNLDEMPFLGEVQGINFHGIFTLFGRGKQSENTVKMN